jgi:hypothetical protein
VIEINGLLHGLGSEAVLEGAASASGVKHEGGGLVGEDVGGKNE